MKDVMITQAALARALGCAKSRISQLIQRGMPQRDDGRLNRQECLRWIIERTSGSGGGWGTGGLRGRASLRERAQQLLEGKPAKQTAGRRARQAREQDAATTITPAAAWRLLLDELVRRSVEIPRILAQLGVRDPVVLDAAKEGFVSLLIAFAGPMGWDGAYDFDAGDDLPLVEPDYGALAQYGVTIEQKHIDAADKLLDRLEAILNPAEPAA